MKNIPQSCAFRYIWREFCGQVFSVGVSQFVKSELSGGTALF